MIEEEKLTALRLTQFSHGSGCGCKIAPALLDEILKQRTVPNAFPSLLVGHESKDDAAVLEISDELCLISTTDFFTPIVDDPYQYGLISAANALSDVYAMGGKPILALAILGFPVDRLPVDAVREILSGARSVCVEAGIPLAGGHSIDLPEPVFGLTVNGLIEKIKIKRNNTAKPGDLLVLTKPLGTGIIAAALKRGVIEPEHLQSGIKVMSRLNNLGMWLADFDEVHAMTDITGFGLLGHLIEMCEGSGLSARIDFESIPLIPGIVKYMDQFIFPDNTYRNWNSFEKKVIGVNGPSFIPLCDPQTSGGLLIAMTARLFELIFKDPVISSMSESFQVVGEMVPKKTFVVEVLEN